MKGRRSRRVPTRNDPIKDATIATLKRAVEPMIELMMDAGVTVHDFNKLIRERAVLVAIKRLLAAGSKNSKSRVAIMTGLPRSQIAKLIGSSKLAASAIADLLPARRILAAWNEDPRFSGADGSPAVLPIFGRGSSFEHLVNRYGGGIPVRAMLDELEQTHLIEYHPEQKVKIRALIPVRNGLTTQSIASVGDRSHDLLRTLARNRRQPDQSLFEGTAASNVIDREVMAAARQEITVRGVNFIKGAASLLNRYELKKNAKSSAGAQQYRIGITAFYFEEELNIESRVEPDASQSRRKNLRRNGSP